MFIGVLLGSDELLRLEFSLLEVPFVVVVAVVACFSHSPMKHFKCLDVNEANDKSSSANSDETFSDMVGGGVVNLCPLSLV